MTTAAQTTTDQATIEALDFDITCQSVTWYVLLNMQAKPECGKPADYAATVHDFRDCSAREKFICAECLPAYGKNCHVCKGPRLTNLRPIRGTL